MAGYIYSAEFGISITRAVSSDRGKHINIKNLKKIPSLLHLCEYKLYLNTS